MLIRNSRSSINSNNSVGILIALFIGVLGFVSPLFSTDIVEEALPSVMSLAEIERQIQLLEARLVEKKTENVLEDIQAIRSTIEQFLLDNPEISQEIRKQAVSLQDRIDILEGAFEYYQNHNDAAKTAFRNLLKRSPQATLDGNIATPSLAEFFESLREKLIGYISIKTTPSNADVFADDQLLGKSPLVGAYILSGEITFRVEKQGYFPQEKKAIIKAGKETSFELILPPNSGTCSVLSVPSDVSVYLDDKLVGKTTGNLPADMIDRVSDAGLNPLEASAPLIIDSIALGQHIIEFKKPCHKSLKFKVNIEIGEFFMPPVKLDPSFSNFEIHSLPTNANVSIEGDFIGQTPVRQERGCAGLRNVRIDLGSPSNWFEEVDFSPDQKTIIHAHPRPTVLVLGCANVEIPDQKESTHRLERWLIQSGQFNVLTGETAEKFQNRAAVMSFIDKVAAPSLSAIKSWETLTTSLSFALKDSNAVLYAFARVSDVNSEAPGTLYFLHPSLTIPDQISIPPGLLSEKAPGSLVRFLREFPVVTETYIGLQVVSLTKGVTIVGIDVDGPAAATSILPGTIVKELNGQPVQSISDWYRLLGQKTNNQVVMLGYASSGSTSTIPIESVMRPLMIPAGDPDYAYNLCLAKLSEQVVFSEIKDVAYLNIGICYMAKGSPKLALDMGFSQANLGSTRGINANTTAYLKAWAAYQTGLYEMSETYLKEISAGLTGRIVNSQGPTIDSLVKNGFKY